MIAAQEITISAQAQTIAALLAARGGAAQNAPQDGPGVPGAPEATDDTPAGLWARLWRAWRGA